ncbi:hypothetical protein Murru_0457 [Allomuricauda ruestringensis DSM 13258]|uniref:DUF2267 domain-containing protein n=1 Tax=Allomuricauda ruestringensis (strain DSM 13258 / CIP 107369 / LMG 19739 / B1) TaxID=886377 RepID=G2PRR2_ALLRU|nr:DUF2267 domain-containing protein [Allomuricauda ruestringensis]AEM69511.1 hypothetical protein Murru_0457 [Allomuricauda ruestringensis DSM 13258]
MALNFNQYAQEGNAFLNEYTKQLGVGKDTEKAGRIFVSIMHALREIISVEESLQFIAQLPMFLKGAYVNGWNPKKRKPGIKHVDEFIELVKQFDGPSAIHDYGEENDLAETYIDVTFLFLRRYVSLGEMEDIRNELPKDLKSLIYSNLMF